MATEHIKIDRETAIEHLVQSWRDHYEVCDDEYIAREYEDYLSEDDGVDITVEIIKGVVC
jgi:hypothetical protein